MEAIAHDLNMEETIHPELSIIQTTFYELIAAINNEVEPEENWLVTEIVLDLIDTGKIKFPGARIYNN